MNIGIYFGTQTGTTEGIATNIARQLINHAASIRSILHARRVYPAVDRRIRHVASPSVNDLLNFANKTVIVSGGSDGIGRGISVRFAEAGADVVVHFNRSASRAAETVAQIHRLGRRAVSVQADVTDAAQVHQLIESAISEFGRLDVLINNAGVYPVNPLLALSPDDWNAVVSANLTSVHLCTQASARSFIAQRIAGAIVNIASIEGTHTAPGHSHYNAAKAGVIMHTKSAAAELGTHGIRVNAVSPGLIWRDGIEQGWPDGVRRWQERAPLHRLGLPDDVADACLFLASSAARWVTGINLVVDGGVTAAPAF